MRIPGHTPICLLDGCTFLRTACREKPTVGRWIDTVVSHDTPSKSSFAFVSFWIFHGARISSGLIIDLPVRISPLGRLSRHRQTVENSRRRVESFRRSVPLPILSSNNDRMRLYLSNVCPVRSVKDSFCRLWINPLHLVYHGILHVLYSLNKIIKNVISLSHCNIPINYAERVNLYSRL